MRALQIAFGKGEVGARLREIGARLIDGVLERPLVDGEQQVALLDDLTVGEMHLLEIAGHARADLDRVDRNEAADIFVLVDDVLLTGVATVTAGGGGAAGGFCFAACGETTPQAAQRRLRACRA